MNKLKRYVIFLIGLFVNSLGVSLITKARKPGTSNFINSICTESQLSVYTWKLYNIFQYISDLTAAFDPAQKLQAGTRITDSGFHHLWIFY